jgi:hypothetical protein
MDIQDITSNLVLDLSASGRTNQDANKDVKKLQKFYEKQGKHSAKVR